MLQNALALPQALARLSHLALVRRRLGFSLCAAAMGGLLSLYTARVHYMPALWMVALVLLTAGTAAFINVSRGAAPVASHETALTQQDLHCTESAVDLPSHDANRCSVDV